MSIDLHLSPGLGRISLADFKCHILMPPKTLLVKAPKIREKYGTYTRSRHSQTVE